MTKLIADAVGGTVRGVSRAKVSDGAANRLD
jgi:hypothetical protein